MPQQAAKKNRKLYHTMKITLPDNYSEVTVGQYMELWKMYEKEDDAYNAQRRAIETLAGLEPNSLQNATWESIEQSSATLNWLISEPDPFTLKMPLVRRFELKGQQYGFIPDMTRLTVGEYADLETMCSSGVFESMNKLCAILFREVTTEKLDKYEIVPYSISPDRKVNMLDLPMNIAVGAIVFFCNTAKELVSTTERYLENAEKSLKAMPSIKNGDGMV